jgi:hypothetical protein
MDNVFGQLVTVATAIVGIAVIAVIVSKNANTAGVISAASTGFSQAISAAVSPVAGGGGFGLNNFGSYNFG